MKRTYLNVLMAVLISFSLLAGAYRLGQAGSLAEPESPVSQAFTYQGQLDNNGSPFTGSCDFTFTMWNAATNGNPVGDSESKPGTPVTNGVFSVQLNESGQFTTGAFNGSQRWLDIAVKCGSDHNPTDLGRQLLDTAPYASYALKAGSVTNGVVTTGSYSDPSWITSLSASKLSGVLPIAKGGTGSGTKNFVDLSSAQAVAGAKTFSSAPSFSQASGAPFSVASSSLVDNLNADRLDGYHAASLQYLRRALPPQDNLLTTLDSAGVVGGYTSITIGSDGLPVISYYDVTNGDLKAAHCAEAACSSADTHTLDSPGDVGGYTSITIGSDGLPVISYYDATNGDLKAAHCADPACSSADLHTLDSAGDVGGYTSITIGSDGLPVISYEDATNGDLKVAHCADPACSSAALHTLDSAGYVGLYTSITIGSDGLPVISYFDNYDLKVAHCSNPLCVPYLKRR